MSSNLEPLDEGEGEEYGRRPPIGRSSSRNSSGRGNNSSGTEANGNRRGSESTAQAGRVMTREMIIRAVEKQGTRMPSDFTKEEKLLAKQTHLHLNGQRISKIDALRPMSGLEVLYLYDNIIPVVENLSLLKNLTHLYLQNNHIRELDGLSGLKSLQKLYLQGNQIQIVSGLRSVPALEELHLNGQRFPPGDMGGLTFDMDCLRDIAGRLTVLSVGACGIRDEALAALGAAGLFDLRKIDLSQNQLHDMASLDDGIREIPSLMVLDLRGNPMTKIPKYRESVILMSDSLTTLDDDAITANQREFLMRLHISKMKAVLRAEEAELKEIDQPQQQPQSLGPAPETQSGFPSMRGAGFSPAPHAARQVSGSSSTRTPSGSRPRATPTIPSKGMAQNKSLEMEGMHLGGR